MPPMKTMTIRLEDDLAGFLEQVARVDGKSEVQVIRDALQAHIDARYDDGAFRNQAIEDLKQRRQRLE